MDLNLQTNTKTTSIKNSGNSCEYKATRNVLDSTQFPDTELW